MVGGGIAALSAAVLLVRDGAVRGHQPHVRGQPAARPVFWGYGLRGELSGDVVRKPMAQATGSEIMKELAHQLRLAAEQEIEFFEGAQVIPCRMPFITSHFMPREPGDRPPVIPRGAENFAVIGQYCELLRDCVFTVEVSCAPPGRLCMACRKRWPLHRP